MSEIYCDISEWTQFDQDLLTFVEKTMPRETKKFMRREGGKDRTATRREARSTIHKKTGNFVKGVGVTRSWQNSQGGYGVKIKARHDIAPHSHLIEYGHRIVTKLGRDTGKRATAFYIYKRANEAFASRFWLDCQGFIYNLVDNGLKGK